MCFSLDESFRKEIPRLKSFERFNIILPLAFQRQRMGLSGKVEFSSFPVLSLAQGKIGSFMIPLKGLRPSRSSESDVHLLSQGLMSPNQC